MTGIFVFWKVMCLLVVDILLCVLFLILLTVLRFFFTLQGLIDTACVCVLAEPLRC